MSSPEMASKVIYMYAYLPHSQQHAQQKVIQSGALKLNMEEENVDHSFPGSRGPDYYTVPIVGYEIVEQRQRFTMYKIHVQKQERSWFIFRRYSDFERLHEKLKSSFPRIELKLPSKRRFGDNFNPEFIAKRSQGLQNYIKTIIQHRDMRICSATQEFFCLHDPPGPFDSLEESRAYVQYLEEQMEDNKSLVKQLTTQLEATKTQLIQAKSKIQNLECTLQTERLQHESPNQPTHSTPAISNTCAPMHVQLSDISDSCPKAKSRKTVSFARIKAASEGNLLLLKNNKKQPFPKLEDQTRFRHSVTFGEDSFFYSGFLDVEFHTSVTDRIKERKRKTRKEKGKVGRQEHCKQEKSVDGVLPSHKLQDRPSENTSLRTSRRNDWKKEKRDSGIIGDSFNDSDFY